MLHEPRIGVRTEAANDVVRYAAAAVQLNREIEMPFAHRIDKRGQCSRVFTLFGKAGRTRKFDQFVEQIWKAIDEGMCPGQTDQRDMRTRRGAAERTEGGHAAQHVAELQRAEDYDALGVESFEKGIHRKNTL